MSEDLAPARLDLARPYKPLDLGNGEAAASVAPDGRLLAVGGFHRRLGYLTLEGAAAFPAGRRGDQPAVRAYRAALAELAATACWDGSLPQARDLEDGTVRSRHWFAWPGAALLVALGGPP
jgi:hypothetical protein